MNILLTGGLGFMGSNLIRYLYDHYPDYRIWNFDLITYAGNPDNLRDIEEKESELPFSKRRYYFIRGDVCDERLLSYLFKEYHFDAVIHLAAESHVDRSITDTRHFIHTNIRGTHALLDTLRAYPVKRFVHISTDEVYGDRSTHGAADESTQFHPTNPYSASKAAADLIVQSYIHTYQIPAIIFRPSNNFGPRQYPEKLIPLTITNLLLGQKVPLHGTGDYTRSWLFVEDFCRAVCLFLHEGHIGESYNIGGAPKTNNEIVHAIATILGKHPEESIEHVKDRASQDKMYLLNWEKAQRLHQFRHEHMFENALAHTVQWYVKNCVWWEKVRATPEFQSYYQEQRKALWF
jgi:dTDP-glucose 4,6-dehydratase